MGPESGDTFTQSRMAIAESGTEERWTADNLPAIGQVGERVKRAKRVDDMRADEDSRMYTMPWDSMTWSFEVRIVKGDPGPRMDAGHVNDKKREATVVVLSRPNGWRQIA